MQFDPFVQAAQTRLIKKGFNVGPDGADGFAGDDTRRAIAEYQRAVGLQPNGMLDQRTWESLDNAAAIPGVDRDSDPQPSDPEWDSLPGLPPVWPRQADVESFFGKPGTNHATLDLPFPMRIAWATDKKITGFAINKRVRDSARRCFEEIARAYSEDERAALGLDLFGGCFNNRTMRGGTRKSMHAYAIAIDFDPIRNQLKWKKPRARLSHDDCIPFFNIWEAEGWLSLGRARDFDWMHVQAARL